MTKSLGKRLASRLGGMRQKLPLSEVQEAHAISQRVVEVLQDESRPRKEALGDMLGLVKSLESAARELTTLTAFYKQQDELTDVAVDQFKEESVLLEDAQAKLELAQHEIKHLETYLTNMEYYAAAILESQEFYDAMIDMDESDYQKVRDAFERIEEARSKH